MEQDTGQLDSALERLSFLLDDEHDCVVKMHYDELLHIVSKKKHVQAQVTHILDSLRSDGEKVTTKNTAVLARQVDDKSKRNELLVRSSLRMVDEVLHLFYSHQPGAGQYDSKGLALAPCGNSTWFDSA